MYKYTLTYTTCMSIIRTLLERYLRPPGWWQVEGYLREGGKEYNLQRYESTKLHTTFGKQFNMNWSNLFIYIYHDNLWSVLNSSVGTEILVQNISKSVVCVIMSDSLQVIWICSQDYKLMSKNISIPEGGESTEARNINLLRA